MHSPRPRPAAASRVWRLSGVAAPGLALTFVLGGCSDDANVIEQRTYDSIHDGNLEAADYWTDQPEILSAGLGFDGIIGVPTLDQRTVEAIGGSWDADLVCTGVSEPDAAIRTSAAATATAATFGSDTYLDDGLPVVFSLPVDQFEHRDGRTRRIHEPVRQHPCLLVQVPLDQSIDSGRTTRANLHHEQRRTRQVLGRELRSGCDQEVRFNNCELRQHYVERRTEYHEIPLG